MQGPAQVGVNGQAELEQELDFDLLPNVFIIGAAKSGTTSVFSALGQHPGVFTPRTKEIRFFSHDDRFARGVLSYQEAHFLSARGYPVRIDATPAYLTWSHKVAPRIKSVYGDRPVKFIAIFRDPVQRAYSHYWHRVRQGDEDPRRLSFEGAIREEEQRLKDHWQRLEYDGNGLFGYFRAGCYATRLEPFLNLFPREQFFFLLHEDLVVDFAARAAAMTAFLGLPEGNPLRPVVSNASAVPRDRGAFRLFTAVKKSGSAGFLRSLVPTGVRSWFRSKVMMKPFKYPPMSTEIRDDLYRRYGDEIRRLSVILNRDLSRWKAA